MKRISLIVPVFNAGAYLPDLISSITAQDWENLQIIFSDDGSVDGSGSLLTLFAARDARVTVVFGENGGVSAARNRALPLADGDFIAFWEADDVPDPGFLRQMAAALEESGADMACCGFRRVYENGTEEFLPFRNCSRQETDRDGMARLLLSPDGYTTVLWNKLFRREALTDDTGALLRFDETLHIVEDGEYIFRSGIRRAVFFPEPLYCYFARGSGAMYGTVNGRKLTEPAARKKIVELTASMAPDVQDLAKMKYQKGIRDLLFHAVISGNRAKVRHLLGELSTYSRELFRSPALTKKERLKYHIYRPIISLNLRHTGALLMLCFGGH